MKLALGTVQFGMDYGVSNIEGQTQAKDVSNILKIAQDCRVELLDTAHLYGESEEVLGQSFPPNHNFKIVTKTPIFKKNLIDSQDVQKVEKAFHLSLSRLKQNTLYALLFHHADDLLVSGGQKLFDVIRDFKNNKTLNKIGVSVYAPQQLDAILDLYDLDIVQLPLNILDQRFVQSECLEKLKERNIEIHARSCFLQGAILMNSKALPDYLYGLKPTLNVFEDFCQNHQITRVAAALNFLMKINAVDAIICGVNNTEQFQELINSALDLPDIGFEAYEEFAVSNPNLINPVMWKN